MRYLNAYYLNSSNKLTNLGNMMLLCIKRNTVKTITLFDIDKSIRRAAHSLIDRVSKNYVLYKVFIYKVNNNYNNIAIVLAGPLRASLLSADGEIIRLGYEVSANNKVKFYTNVLFQNEFESPELFHRPELIKNIRDTGFEVI